MTNRAAPPVFASSEECSPLDGCSPVTVVVAAATRMAAVGLLRARGLRASDVYRLRAGDEGVAEALAHEGQLLWRGYTVGDSPEWAVYLSPNE